MIDAAIPDVVEATAMRPSEANCCNQVHVQKGFASASKAINKENPSLSVNHMINYLWKTRKLLRV
jgi:hypothetical protein